MAYVDGYQYDLFVSYARVDNETANSSIGWVSHFVFNLRIALQQRLGNADNLRIFFDTTSLGGNDQLQQLLESVKRSALLLAIGSPSYAKRQWTQLELKTFASEASALTRIFAIERVRLDDDESYPPPLATHNRIVFWLTPEIEQMAQEDLPLEPTHDLFRARINRLASQIAVKLKELNRKKEKPSAALPFSAPSSVVPSKAVLLAQVTEDLEVEREELKSYIEQYGYRVLGAETYPQGADAFSQAFSRDAAEADLVVQLLGSSEGRIPADLKVSYPRHQAEIIASMDKPCMRWRRADLQLSRVRNPAYRSLLQDPTVTASGFEVFKSEVLARLEHRSPQPAAPQPDAMIFINADNDDIDLAKQLQEKFGRQQVSSVLPMRNGQAAAIRTDLEDNYIDCDLVFFIYGNASPSWVRGQMRPYSKVRGRRKKPPRAVAILIGPPFNKPELGVRLPGAKEIVIGDDLPDKVVELLTKSQE
jgi:TIR domain